MEHSIGFIGGGNMGRAMITALINAGLYQPSEIIVYDAFTPLMQKLQKELGITPTRSVEHLVDEAEMIVLAIKPQVMPSVMEQIGKRIRPETIVVSIAAGVTLGQLEGWISPEHKIVRVMPNTPAIVGAAMSGISVNANVDYDESMQIVRLFKTLGRAELVPEHLMDAVVGISGSSPAYVYMFISALADGAVMEGMSKSQAYIFAAQAVLGSAKMVLESGMHPGELIDMVTSPGGTTIEAIEVLEQKAFRATVSDAVRAAARRNKELGADK